MTRLRPLVALVVLLVLGLVTPAAATPGAAAPADVVAWAASADVTITRVEGQTVRNAVTTTVAGVGLRVQLSNLEGSDPVTFDAVTVGRVQDGATLVPGSVRTVTFGGSPSVTVPAGGNVLSDPVPGGVAARTTYAVSIYVSGISRLSTGHNLALTDTYLSEPGDHSADEGAASYTRSVERWVFVESLVVAQRSTVRTVVGFGDSITDGVGSTEDADRRWTDVLAARLDQRPPAERYGVANEGISGNRVTRGGAGDAAVIRFERDALARAGVETVVLLEGINDVNTGVSAAEIVEGYRDLIGQAHAAGVCLVGGTLTPNEGGNAEREATRQAVNDFIRTSGEFDGVVDFDAAVRDPAAPTRFVDRYDSGDGLHPSDAGYQAMGRAVPLSLLDCGRTS